ncbi:MAG TPA: CoA ester lyase [Acidobacteriota bacterium]|nr:CoA ester lyase [Acidobacteriota bacterium]
MITGLRRSVLYVPGDSERMLQKAAASGADMLLLNLEDGVAPSKKVVARENVLRSLRSLNFGDREVVVRINSLPSDIGRQDLATLASCRPDGICLPKIEQAADIHAADVALLELEIGHGLPEGGLKIHAMIESAAGVMAAAGIAAASRRMASLIFGSADYVADLRCRPGQLREELLFALQMIVTSARAAGIDAIDTPCFDLRNHDLLRMEAQQAYRLGFEGKSALHPGQIAIIHNVFHVTQDEAAWAQRVLAELDQAESRGRALSTLDGQLIDNPHRAAAERLLRRQMLSKEATKNRLESESSNPDRS